MFKPDFFEDITDNLLKDYLKTRPADLPPLVKKGIVNIINGSGMVKCGDLTLESKNGIVTITKNDSVKKYRGTDFASIYGEVYIDKKFVEVNDPRLIVETQHSNSVKTTSQLFHSSKGPQLNTATVIRKDKKTTYHEPIVVEGDFNEDLDKNYPIPESKKQRKI